MQNVMGIGLILSDPVGSGPVPESLWEAHSASDKGLADTLRKLLTKSTAVLTDSVLKTDIELVEQLLFRQKNQHRGSVHYRRLQVRS